QGRAAGFVSRLEGSYTGVVGLPLFGTPTLLAGACVTMVYRGERRETRRRSTLGARRRSHRRAHRRRNLDRIGHSRFSRTAGRVDEEPARGKAIRHPLLHGGSAGAQGVVAVAPRPSGVRRATERRAS